MRSLRDILVVVAIVIGAVLLFYGSQPFGPSSGHYLSGQTAPEFVLPNLANEKVDFDKLRQGKKVMLFFWATWCPHCRDHMVELPKILKRLAKDNIELVLINSGESPERVKQYFAQTGITMDTLMDYDSSVSRQYQASGLPWFVLIDEKGIITGADFGISEL